MHVHCNNMTSKKILSQTLTKLHKRRKQERKREEGVKERERARLWLLGQCFAVIAQILCVFLSLVFVFKLVFTCTCNQSVCVLSPFKEAYDTRFVEKRSENLLKGETPVSVSDSGG